MNLFENRAKISIVAANYRLLRATLDNEKLMSGLEGK